MNERPTIIWEGSIILTNKTKSNVILYQVRPKDIEIMNDGSVGHFGKIETEEVAGNLIKFFKKQTRWVSFEMSNLKEFLGKEKSKKSELLYGLYGDFFDDDDMRTAPLYIVRVGKEYFITDLFINQCMKKSGR